MAMLKIEQLNLIDSIACEEQKQVCGGATPEEQVLRKYGFEGFNLEPLGSGLYKLEDPKGNDYGGILIKNGYAYYIYDNKIQKVRLN